MPVKWRKTGINSAICNQNATKIDNWEYMGGLIPWGSQPSLAS